MSPRLPGAAAAAAPVARAGSDALGGPDDHNPDEGPPFWGFVKDERGVPVRDAKVSASYKNSLTLVTRTNATGAYRVRGFKKGHQHRRRRDLVLQGRLQADPRFQVPPPKGKPVKSVETECRLQRG